MHNIYRLYFRINSMCVCIIPKGEEVCKNNSNRCTAAYSA